MKKLFYLQVTSPQQYGNSNHLFLKYFKDAFYKQKFKVVYKVDIKYMK